MTLLMLIGGTPDGAAPSPFFQMVPFLLILAIFYFAQRYIVAGLTAGAVKG